MFKNLILAIITISLVSFNAYAGSDGELTLSKEQPEEIKDCFEKLNRVTFSFNQKLDKTIIKPVAKSYRNLPDPIQRGAGNAVTNLSNLITIPNNILQGDMRTAIINTARLAVNSTLGIKSDELKTFDLNSNQTDETLLTTEVITLMTVGVSLDV